MNLSDFAALNHVVEEALKAASVPSEECVNCLMHESRWFVTMLLVWSFCAGAIVASHGFHGIGKENTALKLENDRLKYDAGYYEGTAERLRKELGEERAKNRILNDFVTSDEKRMIIEVFVKEMLKV